VNAVHDTHLSQVLTHWSLLGRAHAADAEAAREARAEFLPRYCAPVYRYLLGIVGNADRAEELAQEFALRFVRGDFRHARPERGRFRDYLKAALRHLVAEVRRRPALTVEPLPDQVVAPTPAADAADAAEFVRLWRHELINRAWAELEHESNSRGQLLYQALRLKADAPDRSALEVARLLADANRRPVTADSARQFLHRARQRFAALLRQEVAISLPTDDDAAIDEELADLGLLVYVTT